MGWDQARKSGAAQVAEKNSQGAGEAGIGKSWSHGLRSCMTKGLQYHRNTATLGLHASSQFTIKLNVRVKWLMHDFHELFI